MRLRNSPRGGSPATGPVAFSSPNVGACAASRVDCARRLECVELAPAFDHGGWPESASKLDALQTLREVRQRMKWVELAPAFEHAGWPESASKLDALQTLREVRRRSAKNHPPLPVGRS